MQTDPMPVDLGGEAADKDVFQLVGGDTYAVVGDLDQHTPSA